MINNLAFQLVFFGKKRELYRLGNLHGIAILYFFALMQKSNKKNQSAAADKIKELAGRVSYFMGCAGSNSLDFLTADVEHFKHFLFKGTKHLL